MPTKQIKFNQNLMQQCSQFPLQRAMMSDKTPRSFQNVHRLAAWEYTALFKVETFIAKHHMQTKIKKKTMQTPNLSEMFDSRHWNTNITYNNNTPC